MTLQARHLSCKALKKTLISGVCLDFTPGNLWGIVGPNGAGKTTLLKALAGLWPLATGDVTWEGQPLFLRTRQEISKIISFVPQQPPIAFDFSVYEIVAMGRYAHRRTYHNEADAIMDALEAVDMSHHANSMVNELSSGERQRVYIARALVSCAPVILLDEPTASLDIRHQLEIWALLLKLIDQQRTVIASQHDLSSAANFCHQIAVMHQGQCIAHGKTHEILTDPLIEKVFGVVRGDGPRLMHGPEGSRFIIPGNIVT